MSSKDRKYILVVDDEASIREMLRFDLEELGLFVEEASEGATAWKKIGEREFDFVLSDVRMPELDGVGLLRKIQAKSGHRPQLILMTGHAGVSHEDALKMGAAAVLSKPFSLEQLQGIIAGLEKVEQGVQARRSPRVEVKIEGKISYSPIGETKVVFENLSKAGFFVYTSDPIPSPDTLVTFELNLGSLASEIVSGEGVVKWVRIGEYPVSGFGVQITRAEDSAIQVLGNFLHKKDPERFSPVN